MTYRGIVAYWGRAYSGFERQPHRPTIQGTLEKALSQRLNVPTTLLGAGRTDAGVSARGQVFSFKTEKPLGDLAALTHALNRLLPSDIAILSLAEADPAFDARRSAKGKIYSYALNYGERDPLGILEAQMPSPAFDPDLFEAACRLYDGERDFRDFTTKPEDKSGFVRHLTVVSLTRQGTHLVLVLRGDGFMTYMARILVGAAYRVAIGKMPLTELKAHLSPAVRSIIPFKAGPEGLVLEAVLYA